MNSKLALTLSCMLALASAACSDDKDGPVVPVDGSVRDGGTGLPDAATALDGATPDATVPDGGGVVSVTLVNYVNDLLNNHTDDVSLPDDVASKTIVDTEDPAAFNSRFP